MTIPDKNDPMTDPQAELTVLERVTRERDEARAELAKAVADHQEWRAILDPLLDQMTLRAESWSEIARAQARELTALRESAHAALEQLTAALTEPTDAAGLIALRSSPPAGDGADNG